MKIKPCPFCGTSGAIVKYNRFVQCSDERNCYAFGPSGYNDEDAIKKWNERVIQYADIGIGCPETR